MEWSCLVTYLSNDPCSTMRSEKIFYNREMWHHCYSTSNSDEYLFNFDVDGITVSL